jgi:hypothetical protein
LEKDFWMMEILEITTYSDFIINNSDIWQQAIFIGILIVGSSALMGLMLLAVVKIFTMLAR